MIQPEPQEQKRSKREGIVRRLPRLGRISQLLLLVGVSLIIIIALWVVYQQQLPKRAELQQTLATLQRALDVSPKQKTSKDVLLAQLKSAEAETEAAKMLFCSTDQSPEILDKLLKLAQLYDLEVMRTEQSTPEQATAIGSDMFEPQVLSYNLELRGQVADFQNFLLALGSKLPTSTITKVEVSVAETEGEQDMADIIIDVFCYESE